MTAASYQQAIATLREETATAAVTFLEQHRAELEHYRAELTDSIKLAKDRLQQDVAEISANHPLCLQVVRHANEYIDWLQWSLWDVPYYAAAIRPEPERFKKRVAACAMLYLAGRVFDDVIDRHFWYKAKRPTLFSVAASTYPSSEGAESLTILTGLLLCAESLFRLVDSEDPEFLIVLQRLLASFRRVVIGATMEQAGRDGWDPDSYERLIYLKNVDFWRCLYTALDPRRTSPLYPFLERYYALAQKLNDIQDFPEDERRGQPNLVSLYLQRSAAPASAGNGVGHALPPGIEEHLAAKFLELGDKARKLPPSERGIALHKLGESLHEAFRLGLFAASQANSPSGDRSNELGAEPASESRGPPEISQSGARPLGLLWHSSLQDVVEKAGISALQHVDCGVCGGRRRKRLFEKQGFTLHRCLGCSHVYVSPRVSLDVQLGMAEEREDDDDENDFLEVQSIFAEPICHLLRLRARGTRLLDLGFGRGYILKLARAYGFETYGVDSSHALKQKLEPEFGRGICRGRLGLDRIPWNAFDVVVMSHVAEHLANPASVLKEVLSKLSPGGILYLAVPDIDSLQFKIFGKNWDVISPLAHLQYFNEKSLTRLLSECGFEGLERISHPELPKELTPKWMRLMRKLGGDESGELGMLARRPLNDRLPVMPEDAAAQPITLGAGEGAA